MKKFLLGLTVAAVIVVAGLAIALMRVNIEQFRPQIEAGLSQSLGRPVQVGAMSLSLREWAFAAQDIRIGEDPAFAKEPFVAADRLSVQVALWPLLSRRDLQVKRLDLQHPNIRLLQNKRGRWNFESLGEGVAAGANESPGTTTRHSVRIDALRVEGGELTIRSDDGSERKLSDVKISADGLASDRPFYLLISAIGPGGASARIEGSVGPLAAGDLMMSPLKTTVSLDSLDLASGLPGGGLAGTLSYRGDVSVDKGALAITGVATLDRLRLYPDAAIAPTPITFAHRLSYNINTRRGELSQGAFSIAESTLAINGKLDNRKAQMTLDLGIEGKTLQVDRVQPLLPMLGIVLPEDSSLEGGTLDLSLHARGTLDALTIVGPMQIAHSRLKGFSLGGKVSGVMSLAGLRVPDDTVIDTASADMTLSAAGVAMRNIVAIITDLGRLTGEGNVDANTNLDFHLRIQPDAALASGESSAGGSVAAALQGAMGKSSRDGIGLSISGNADQPKFKVDTKSIAGAVLSGLVAGKSGDANATPLDKAALKEKAADALIQGLFGKKKKAEAEPAPEPEEEGK